MSHTPDQSAPKDPCEAPRSAMASQPAKVVLAPSRSSVRPSEAERLRQEIAVFNRERDEALLSLDETRIRAMFRKWNEREMPENPEVFWGSVHKAITGSLGLPIEFRRKSKAWLAEHGLRSLDDGDL